MSVDKYLTITPYSSPYRCNANNPIVYKDIDGNREYITIIITDEKTGEVNKTRIKVSNNVMTDGKKHQINPINPASLFYTYEVKYYDFETVYNYVKTKDGKIIQSGDPLKNQLITDFDMDAIEDVRETEYGEYYNLPSIGSNDIQTDETDFLLDILGNGGFAKGGIMFYSGSGGASKTKWKTKEDADVEATDISDVLAAFSALKGSTLPNSKELLGVSEAFSTLKDLYESNENFKTGVYQCDVCLERTNDTSASRFAGHSGNFIDTRPKPKNPFKN